MLVLNFTPRIFPFPDIIKPTLQIPPQPPRYKDGQWIHVLALRLLTSLYIYGLVALHIWCGFYVNKIIRTNQVNTSLSVLAVLCALAFLYTLGLISCIRALLRPSSSTKTSYTISENSQSLFQYTYSKFLGPRGYFGLKSTSWKYVLGFRSITGTLVYAYGLYRLENFDRRFHAAYLLSFVTVYCLLFINLLQKCRTYLIPALLLSSTLDFSWTVAFPLVVVVPYLVEYFQNLPKTSNTLWIEQFNTALTTIYPNGVISFISLTLGLLCCFLLHQDLQEYLKDETPMNSSTPKNSRSLDNTSYTDSSPNQSSPNQSSPNQSSPNQSSPTDSSPTDSSYTDSSYTDSSYTDSSYTNSSYTNSSRSNSTQVVPIVILH